jgi:hypothetical protein
MTNIKNIRIKRSRIAGFKQPFIAGMLTSASMVTGCHHPEPPEDGTVCPATVPTEGESCFGYDQWLSCGEPCTGDRVVRCDEDGTWTEIEWACNPPPQLLTDCPSEPPTIGTPCYDYEPGLACFGAEDCGANVGAVCGELGVWEETASYLACNPPYPIFDAGGEPESSADGGAAQ